MRESIVTMSILIVLILIAAVIATWGVARVEGLLTL
jgi:hypothetical protein